MKIIFTLPTWQVFLFLIIPAFFPITEPIGIIFTIIWGILLAYCVYFLGSNLFQKLPPSHDLKLKRFYFHLFFPLIYIVIVLITFKGGYEINQDNYTDYGWISAVIIPFHLFSMYCIFYTIWFLAKSIATIENNKTVGFDTYAGNFFLLWFFPIGIWWMHPKVRRIFSDNSSNLIAS